MRTVFVGNCQMVTLCQLYRATLGDNESKEVHYIASYEHITDEQREILARAERVVWQVTDMDNGVSRPDCKHCHLVPVVSAQFLFPLSGEPHPHNRSFPFCMEGPYPGENGDTLLNKMIVDGVSNDQAVKRYFESDVATRFHVDRMLEISLDRQKQRDDACGGYQCSEIIARDFQEVPLFMSRGHLYAPITKHIVERLFSEEMKLSPLSIEIIRNTDPQKFVPPSEQSIHPSIADRLGLRFFRDDSLYAFHFEGRFTSKEWASRYMGFEWSRDLAEGLWHFYSGRSAAAIPFLLRAQKECPRSTTVVEVLKHARSTTDFAG